MIANNSVIPVIVGTDNHAYSVARAFFEAGVKETHLFERGVSGIADFSKIIKSHICAGLDDVDALGPALFDFSIDFSENKILVLSSDMGSKKSISEFFTLADDRFINRSSDINLPNILLNKIILIDFLRLKGIPVFCREKCVFNGEKIVKILLSLFVKKEIDTVVKASEIILEISLSAGIKNSAITLLEPTPLSFKILKAVEEIGYLGLVNFEIILIGDNEYLFDVDFSETRAIEHLYAGGVNIGEILIKGALDSSFLVKDESKSVYWHSISHAALREFADNKNILRSELLRMSGREYYDLQYDKDDRFPSLRKALVYKGERKLLRDARKTYRIGKDNYKKY